MFKFWLMDWLYAICHMCLAAANVLTLLLFHDSLVDLDEKLYSMTSKILGIDDDDHR